MAKSDPHDEFEALLKKLQKRCRDTKIIIKEDVDPEDEPYLILSFPCGRETRKIYCFSTSKAKKILSIPFERYIFLNDYTAICSYDDGIIEAAIDSLENRVGPSFIYRRLFGQRIDFEETDLEELIIDIKNEEGDEELQISIGPMSKSLQALTPPRLKPYHPSLKIEGAQVARHNQALNLLEKISNSIFFQIDQSIGLSLGVIRERQSGRLGARKIPSFDPDNFQFPRNEYDEAPMSLYWYARSARGMPLLQFLAYYQVIEFYFPTYSQIKVKRKIRNIIKDPTFRPDRDVDLGRILSTIAGGNNYGFGDERSQLKATLQACLDSEALREFICDVENRKEFLSSKAKGLTDKKIPVNNPSADIRNDVAERIYDIRCKIVHTKSGGRDEEVELLLPFSKEAEQLYFDIELIRYVSSQILIAASSQLKI